MPGNGLYNGVYCGKFLTFYSREERWGAKSPAMLADLQKALTVDQRVQITVWDSQDDSVEHTFSSYVMEAGGNVLRVASPSSPTHPAIPLLQRNVVVGVLVEVSPNPYIFYPVIHSEPSPQGGFWLKIPDNPAIEIIQRRRHVRIPMLIPFELEYLDGGQWVKLSARTEDMSGGGARFTASRLFLKGQDLLLVLPLDATQPPLRLKAKVIFSAENRVKKQSDDLYVTACEFQELDAAGEMMLVRECFRRELGLKQ